MTEMLIMWACIGADYYRRMFGARLRGGKYTHELVHSVIK